MRRAVLAFALFAGCHHAEATDAGAAPAKASTTPAPTSSASSPPPAPVTATPHELAVVGGDLVDLGSMAVLHALTTDSVFTSALGGDAAYLWAHLAAGGSELRAYDVASGRLRWSKPAVDCWHIAASNAGVFCGGSAGARWFRSADGTDKVVTTSSVSATTTLGRRVLVVDGATIQAFDALGASVGATPTPASAQRNARRTALDVGGLLACGAEESRASTTVFCVDASPRVVWSRHVPVASGQVRQVDADVMVVTSDSWSKTPASEIVRTSDGKSLLHVEGVRFAAALTTAGVFDAALTAEPDVSLYDANGRKKWTWSAPPPHNEGLRATRAASTIVIAQYNPISVGAQLHAIDERSGAHVWAGNVESLLIGHSKYWNDVVLTNRGTSLLLIGHESSQDYAQTFDAKTGVREASLVRRR